MPSKVCSTKDCGKKVIARGFCGTCYVRLVRHGIIQTKTQTFKFRHRLSNIDEINKRGICAHCGDVKVIRRGKSSGLWRCSIESNERARDFKRAKRQRKKNQLLDYCEICGTKKDLCWDHNHATEMFRGTLCKKCNTAIGMLGDDPQKCINAANYLSKTNEQTTSGAL